uniref:NYN domain-containing protein n=1 Tax=Noccaea caerulescens TaxID=107243 RepID=A0A1J3D4J2_NOCCA
MSAEPDGEILVHVFWDLNKSELTNYPRIVDAPNVLVDNMNTALKTLNHRYKIHHITACGNYENFIYSRMVENIYAPERYCLCNDCTRMIRSNSEYALLRHVDTKVYFDKRETPDLMLTRMIHNEVRKNRENRDVILLITGDPAFQKLMMDIQSLGNTVLLAYPAGAENFVGFGLGITAKWRLQNLIYGGPRN